MSCMTDEFGRRKLVPSALDPLHSLSLGGVCLWDTCSGLPFLIPEGAPSGKWGPKLFHCATVTGRVNVKEKGLSNPLTSRSMHVLESSFQP